MNLKNILFCGDNMKWMKDIPDESVDLCYIDPPFFSNAVYEVIWGNSYEKRSFEDRFAGGIYHYIEWMRERIVLIRKKLKKTGSFYLHCDHHASHYLKVVCDEIFGQDNFRNEIVWCYTSPCKENKDFPSKHDVLLRYSKSDAYLFYGDAIRVPYKKKRTGTSKGSKFMKEDYTMPKKGKIPEDWWTEDPNRDRMTPVGRKPTELIGYNTQKPESLLKRIVLASSNKGDLVMDCFVGGGTTAKVCADLDRHFICGDLSPVAVRVSASRLNARCPKTPYRVEGLPQTEQALRKLTGHHFAELVCRCMGWDVNEKKSADQGIDGWADHKKIPIQIKNHRQAIGRPDLQKFVGAMQKYKKGFFVAWSFSKQALEYVAEVKNNEGKDIKPIHCKEDIFEDLLITQNEEAKLRKYFLAATDKQPQLNFYSPLTHNVS